MMRLIFKGWFFGTVLAIANVGYSQDLQSCQSLFACDDAVVCSSESELQLPGPWSVGNRRVELGDLTIEVWYPAEFGSHVNGIATQYDLRQWLPETELTKIPDDQAPKQICDCVADLPIDQERGPYPVILFAHGTAAFRTQSLSLMTDLASRGFIVLAADHPGLYLKDLLQGVRGADLPADLQKILAALRSKDPIFDFLADRTQAEKIGLIGHSAGGGAIAGLSLLPGVELLVPMAASGSQAGSNLRSTLVLGAIDDRVVPFARQIQGFQFSPAPKRLIGLGNAGHLAFSDLCGLKNEAGEDLVALASKYQIENAESISRLWDGCEQGQLAPRRSAEIVNYLVSAAALETLQCQNQDTNFLAVPSKFPEVLVYEQQTRQ